MLRRVPVQGRNKSGLLGWHNVVASRLAVYKAQHDPTAPAAIISLFVLRRRVSERTTRSYTDGVLQLQAFVSYLVTTFIYTGRPHMQQPVL